MKKLVGNKLTNVLIFTGLAAVLTWTASVGLDIETRVHYFRARVRSETITTTVTPSGANTDWLNANDSGRAAMEHLTDRHAPTDHAPVRINVDGAIFTLHYARRSELLRQGCAAQIVFKDRQIWLPDDETGREARQNVLHELMHAALYKAGGQYQHPVLSDYGDGEPVVNPTARILLTVLRDNPKLVAWFAR